MNEPLDFYPIYLLVGLIILACAFTGENDADDERDMGFIRMAYNQNPWAVVIVILIFIHFWPAAIIYYLIFEKGGN